MKTLTYLFLVIIIFATTTSCEKRALDFEKSYKNSLAAWTSFKEENKNNYEFVVDRSSVFGTSTETTITVKEGKISSRKFQYTMFNDVRMPDGGWTLEVAQQAIESMKDLGWGGSSDPFVEAEKLLSVLVWEEHAEPGSDLISEQTQAALAWPLETLDQIYNNAWELIKKRPGTIRTFEANNDGMISTAGYRVEGCMDDCFNGVYIKSIRKI